MKQENIELEGTVTQELGNSMFKVEIVSGQEILCTISGKIRKNFIKIITGDNVKVEVSPYDLTRGRITKRFQAGKVNEDISSVNNNKSNNKNKKRK